jgi:hypothetical protein
MTPYVWARGSGSVGWKDTLVFDYNHEVRWGRVLAPVTTDGADFETFVYQIMDPSNPSQAIGWFPAPPDQAVVAFTANGPSSLVGVEPDATTLPLTVQTLSHPAAGRVRFVLTLPAAGIVRATIFDPMGRKVRQVHKGELPAGAHSLTWDGRASEGTPCRSGVFFCHVDFSGHTVMQRFVFLNPGR